MKQISKKQEKMIGSNEVRHIALQTAILARRGVSGIHRAVEWLRMFLWSFYDDAGDPDGLRRL